MTESQKMKRNFRATKKWKLLKRRLKQERKKDEITLSDLRKTWQLHHKDLREENYKNIDDDKKFSCLNSKTHEVIHWLYKYWVKDKSVLERIEKLLKEMEKYSEC